MKSKELNHLGLVAGIIDQLSLVEGMDSPIKQDMSDWHISIGLGAKAMLLKGLGFS